MTRLRPDDEEKAILQRWCPYCAAAEGTWCMNYRSEYVRFLHAERYPDYGDRHPRRVPAVT
jgi:hypothetical protein